ncbi:MAG: hypothetical protein EBV86_15925, partial [Marivivens sp.]|nr:hypothetical protein [Marivivens sp.]
MGQLTQTTAQVQVILDDADAANVGKTSLTDSTDTTAVAVRKSGFYSLSASSSNAPSTDRAILISAVRDTTATGEIRYGQVAITESNGMWWNRDDGGTLGTWYEAVSTAGTQTLTNKTLTSPVLTTPQINDTSANHQYVFAVSELVADRTVTLPLLTGNDTFVSTFAGQTISDLGTVTTANIDGGSIDGTTIGASTAAAITGTTITATDDVTLTGASYNAVWDSSDNALEFADNAKAIFGAGDDLQIYHDGTHSVIEDAGTGNLILQSNGAQVSLQSTTELYLTAANNGAVTAYHNGSAKLATTSTGIDVTGTVTADGLTVQSTATTRPTIGNSDVNTSGLTTGLNFEPISNISNGAKINVISGLQPTVASAYTAGFEFVTEDHAGGGSFAQTKALTIGASGDISFYEDTGNTAKFFWDASAENLTITGQGNQLLLARS